MDDLLILGAGGHARVIVSVLRLLQVHPAGCVAPEAPDANWYSEIPWLGTDRELSKRDPATTRLVSGVGGTRSNERRQRIFEFGKSLGFRFHTVLHPRAIVAEGAVIEEGAVVMAGAIIQVGCTIGRNAIINTGAIVDHDCVIGAHAHIAPGVRLSGNVSVGRGTHIGTGASVIQGITIGESALLAAGCVAIDDVPDRAAVAGVPARSMLE